MYAYNVSCRKDSQTGQFCDPYLLQWSQQGMGANQTCSDCWLGGQAMQLNNPLGYDADLASNFASLTSSCSANGKYTFTVPASTTSVDAGPTTTPAPSVTPICSGSYKLKSTDTDCNVVAKALSVSTYDLLIANNIDLYCQNFYSTAQNGTTLCVPGTCQTYTWQAEDSCDSVLISRPGISLTQFLAWNPNFNTLCGNVGKFIGYQVCLSPPGGFVNSTAAPGGPGPSATVPVPKPTNGVDGSNKPCGQWYTIASGDTCAVVSLANGLTLEDLYFLNPSLNVNCTNLLLGIAYCVAPVGDIATYTGHPTTTRSGAWATISVPPATFPPVNTAITTKTGDPGYVATTSMMPTASGTVGGCKTYRNFSPNETALNDCGYVAYAYEVTVEQLRQWNPSLGTTGDCVLKSGFSYCVESNTPVGELPAVRQTTTANADGHDASQLRRLNRSTVSI
jgi:LysM repeat protein